MFFEFGILNHEKCHCKRVFRGSQTVHLTPKDIEKADKQLSATCWDVSLQFTPEGSQKFAELTRNNIKRRLGIILDGELVIAPIIRTAITDGKAVITGSFTEARAQEIATLVRGERPPLSLKVANMLERKIPPVYNSLATMVLYALLALLVINMLLYTFGDGDEYESRLRRR